MNHWLMEHFDGEWYGGHHQYQVPHRVRDYFIFAVIRNPYERWVSGHYAVTWDDHAPTDDELQPYRSKPERLIKMRKVLAAAQKQIQRPAPEQSVLSLEQRKMSARERNKREDHLINQARFVERSGVRMALYFERLPQCLSELPFVDSLQIPPFPNHPERGIRPTGDFFEQFADTDEEEIVWAHAEEDFRLIGYSR